MHTRRKKEGKGGSRGENWEQKEGRHKREKTRRNQLRARVMVCLTANIMETQLGYLHTCKHKHRNTNQITDSFRLQKLSKGLMFPVKTAPPDQKAVSKCTEGKTKQEGPTLPWPPTPFAGQCTLLLPVKEEKKLRLSLGRQRGVGCPHRPGAQKG